MTSRFRPYVAAGVAAACVLTVSSCASLEVNAIPAPGASYDDGYDIVMQFASVLNLPERAKVVLDGVTVGVVSKTTLTGHDVDVTARVGHGVVIPSDIHAVLQQATVLGDIYVALERPPAGATPAPALTAGAAIPITQTTSPPQLEDTIASLANFVSSGSIQRVQNTIIRLNRVVPSSDEVRTLTTRVETDLSALSTNIDRVDQLLDGVSKTAAVVNGHIPELQYWFSPTGQRGFEHLIAVSNYIATVLPGYGSITRSGYWLVPFLKSLADSVGALQESKVAGEAEIPKYRHLFTDFFLPVDKYPAINITSIIGPDGRELSGNVQDVLRILGATP
jgi:phospholipid/cholesterol/gamma-HCH transport system substrate-binding protein